MKLFATLFAALAALSVFAIPDAAECARNLDSSLPVLLTGVCFFVSGSVSFLLFRNA